MLHSQFMEQVGYQYHKDQLETAFECWLEAREEMTFSQHMEYLSNSIMMQAAIERDL